MIYTIGYEGLSIREFIDTLVSHGIEIVVDVRELPLSRKPGFSKRTLDSALEEVEIQYCHTRELGAPKIIRENLKTTGNWHEYREAYWNILLQKDNYLEELAKTLLQKRVCLMCFEKDYRVCHRSLIVERMNELDFISEIEHLSCLTEKAGSVASAR